MKIIYPLLGLLLLQSTVQAQGLSASEAACLGRIRSESEFIVSRINFIHRGYEKQLRSTALGHFSSGDYSTSLLLDNTIRKYHTNLVHKIRNYPLQYASRLRGTQQPGGHTCLARKLHVQAVGTIHKFELKWKKALAAARANADYFRHMDEMR